MLSARLLAALCCVACAGAQSARPYFRPERVIPSFGETPLMLAPGMVVSIYGNHLGPAEGCRGYGDQKRGVQVRIGEAAAGLTWVQADQINFQVPAGVPFEGVADLRVIYNGSASDSVPLRFGLERMTITQDEPAHVDAPVWVRVHTAFDLQRRVQFPFQIDPLWMNCEDIEVRRNGAPLPRLTPKNPLGRVFAGNLCGMIGLAEMPAKAGRLPLHLFYRFDTPGEYEVRFTRMEGDAKTIRDRTEWTAITVLPSATRKAVARPQSATEMLSDYLPSLMGYGDATSLPLLVDALYDADEMVCQFAQYGLADYYDRGPLLLALRAAIVRRGSNETVSRLVDLLSSERLQKRD
jgi:hypothetical protein